MRYVTNTLLIAAICVWLYFFVVQLPLLLTAGTWPALVAIALSALGAFCIAITVIRKIKGPSKKEVSNENRTPRHDCGPGTCNHRL